MIRSIIVAVAENGVIGKDNDLVWSLPDDMRYFMNKTKGHHVLMGRKNYESLKEKYRPLPNRTNIIITRNTNYEAPGAHVFNELMNGISFARENKEPELFIIGGGQIYSEVLKQDLVDRVYLTQVHSAFEGDTFFPELDQKWTMTSSEFHPADDRHDYSFEFQVFEKK